MPHFSHDPIVAGSSIVMALQTIVARNVDPLKPAVVTVGMFQAGTVNNVIPGAARLELSVRALDREVRQLLRRRIHEIARRRPPARLRGRGGLPGRLPGAGQHARRDRVCRARGHRTGGRADNFTDKPAVMGSEDFAFMLEHRPGCYLFLGNGDGEGSCMVHNPGYDFNDAAMETGAAFWSLLAERFLA